MTGDMGSNIYDEISVTMNCDSSTEHSGSAADLKRKIKDEPIDEDTSCKYARYDSPTSGYADQSSVSISNDKTALRNKCGNSEGGLTEDTAGVVGNNGSRSVQSTNAEVKELLNGKSVLSISNGLVTARRISSAPAKEPAEVSATQVVSNPRKRPSKLHRCRICLKIFASGDFLSKHVAQKHSEKLNSQTVEVKQDVNKTINQTSEHEVVRSEHQIDNSEHQLRGTEHQLESHEPNFKKSEHQFWNGDNQPGNSEHLLVNTEHELGNIEHQLGNTERQIGISENDLGNTEYLFRNIEHQLRNTEHQFGKNDYQLENAEHRFRDEVNVVRPEEEEKSWKKEEQHLMQEEEKEEGWLMTENRERIRDDKVLGTAWRLDRDWNGTHWLCVCGLQFKTKNYLEKHQLSCPTYIIEEQRRGGTIGVVHLWCVCGGRYKYQSHLRQHQMACPTLNTKGQSHKEQARQEQSRKDPLHKEQSHKEQSCKNQSHKQQSHQEKSHKVQSHKEQSCKNKSHKEQTHIGSMDGVHLWCICGNHFKVQDHLENHQMYCSKYIIKQQGGLLEGRLLFCVCGFRFKSPNDLDKHQVTCPKYKYISQDKGGSMEGSLNVYTCQKCGLHFKTMHNLFVHQEFRNVCEPYRCSKKDDYLPNPSMQKNNLTSKGSVSNVLPSLNQSIADNIKPEHRNPVVVLNDCMKGMKGRQKKTLCIVNKKPRPTKEESYPCPNCHKRFRALKFLLLHQANRRCYSRPARIVSLGNQRLPRPTMSNVHAISDGPSEQKYAKDALEIVPGSSNNKEAPGSSLQTIPGGGRYTSPGTAEETIPGYSEEETLGKTLPGCSEALENHEQHYKHQVFFCEICDSRFMEHGLLKNHMRMIHQQHAKDLYSCDLCAIEFVTQAGRDKHMEKHYGKVQTCDICDRGFLKPENLKKHFETHAHDGVRKCRFCEARFTHEQDLKGHTKWCHGLRGESHSYFKDHVRVKVGAKKPYSCNLCNVRYAGLLTMTAHFVFHQRSFDCKFCGVEFVTEVLLLYHLEQAHNLHCTLRGTSRAGP